MIIGQDKVTPIGYQFQKSKLLVVGRRFGKTKMFYYSFVNSLPISQEDKQKLIQEYEKLERGE